MKKLLLLFMLLIVLLYAQPLYSAPQKCTHLIDDDLYHRINAELTNYQSVVQSEVIADVRYHINTIEDIKLAMQQSGKIGCFVSTTE